MTNKKISFWIGYDSREVDGWVVTAHSLRTKTNTPYPINVLSLEGARQRGFNREFVRRDGKLWDEISNAPMSTEFAISRFMLPFLQKDGWAVFMDCDMLVMRDIDLLVNELDEKYALMCVKHDYTPRKEIKMDNQIQTKYSRKNWSSVMAMNLDHPSNKKLALELINTARGRDLHNFCWLEDHEIGGLDKSWNWLEGEDNQAETPSIVHFTNGLPSQIGDCDYADQWWDTLNEYFECHR
jgi:lipopolysaccharide biosynthesis glycosyltransferase